MLYGEKGRLFRSWLSRKRYPGDHPDHFLDLRLYYEIFGRKDRCRSYPFNFRFYDRLDSRLDLHDLDETYPAHHSPMITPFDSYSLLRRLPKGGRLILSAPSRFRKAPSCCPVCISYNIRKGDEAPDPRNAAIYAHVCKRLAAPSPAGLRRAIELLAKADKTAK